MPMPHKGPRICINVRLPYDEYHEVARRAKLRDWSMSQYIAYCVAREIGSRRVAGRRAKNSVPNIDLIHSQFDMEDDDGLAQ